MLLGGFPHFPISFLILGLLNGKTFVCLGLGLAISKLGLRLGFISLFSHKTLQ